MQAHLPGLRTEPGRHVRATTVAAAVRMPGGKEVPLDVAETNGAVRGLLAALAAARTEEQVRVQVILGPRHRPRSPGDVPTERRSGMKAKYSEHRFSAEVRVGSKADDVGRARRLVQGAVAALRPLEAPGVSLRITRANAAGMDQVRDPFLWPLELGVSEVAGIIGWPIAPKDTVLPGVPSSHPKMLPVASRIHRRGRILGVSALDESRTVALDTQTSLRHTHLLGPNGVGKSVLMTNLVLDDIAAGRSVVVVDAKGDQVADVLARMDPRRADDVVVLDPTDIAPVGIDAFDGDPNRAADVLTNVIKDLYGGDIGPRSGYVLHGMLLSLARAGGASLSMLPLLLSNPTFQREIKSRIVTGDPLGLGKFWAQFESYSEAERAQVVMPLSNKIDPVLAMRPELRAIFGQPDAKFAMSDIFTRRRIVLVNLGTAQLGPEGARLLGSILLALLWQTAQRRTAIPPEKRHPVMVHVDEMQEVVRLGDLGDALAKARGLGVGFTLAHQSLTQVPTMREALLANARTRVCFQLGAKDAAIIAETSNGALVARDFMELPAYGAYVSTLVDGDRMPWASIATEPLPEPIRDPLELVRASRERYGRPLAEIEHGLLERAGLGASHDEEISFGRADRGGAA
jgi:hypothetical protein